MDKQESRRQFEEWARGEGFSLKRGIPEGAVSCIYTDGDTYILWQAWQASRASIVVVLPKSHSVSDGMLDGEMVMVSDVIESLRSIGLSIKGEGV